MIFVRISLAIDVLLMAVEHVVPVAKIILPLGGDPFVQLSALLLLGVGVHELNSLRGKSKK